MNTHVGRRRTGGGRSGLGLVEIMFALALLVTILAGGLLFLDQVMSRFQAARDHYVAITICQGRIERARAIPYADLPLMAEDRQGVDDYGTPAANGRFRRTTRIRPSTPSAGLTTLDVRTEICRCSRWGWRTRLHPLNRPPYVCGFDRAHERMKFLFTNLEGD